MTIRLGLCIASMLMISCGSASPSRKTELTPHPRAQTALRWEPCPPMPPVESEPPGLCSQNKVPLFWEGDGSGEIDVLVRKLEPESERRGTIWMLAGGPGGTGAVFSTPAWRSISVDRGLALMIPTPRGAGYSTPLQCPAQEASDSELGALVSADEFGPCARTLSEQWGEGLAGFTSIEAARDVVHFMGREKRDGEQTFVWGGSYGSFWAQRIAELSPDLVDGYILEGLVPSDVDFLDLSANVNEALYEALDQCAAVAACGGHFATGPRAAADALVAAGSNDSCLQVLGVDVTTRQRLFAAPFLADTTLHALLLPLLLRFSRCSSSDQRELALALPKFPNLAAPQPAMPSLKGTLLDPMVQNLRLASLIVHSDLIRADRTLEQIRDLEQGLLASGGRSLIFHDEHDEWPEALPHRVPVDSRTAAPMLLFGGALDAQTPLSWSRRVASHFNGEAQRLVVMPNAGHMTYTFAKTASGSNCTVDLWRAFLQDPGAELDTSCIDTVVPIDWSGASVESRQLATRYFGTTAVWGRPD